MINDSASLTRVAFRVAFNRFLERPQRLPRNTRPPSRGNAGTRLNAPGATLIAALWPRTAMLGTGAETSLLRNQGAPRTPAIGKLVKGPANALRTSEPESLG